MMDEHAMEVLCSFNVQTRDGETDSRQRHKKDMAINAPRGIHRLLIRVISASFHFVIYVHVIVAFRNRFPVIHQQAASPAVLFH